MSLMPAEQSPRSADPLPSWNPGGPRAAVLNFVSRVTREGGPEYVPPPDRIAVFDNDGTLWCEQPLQAQVFFLIDRVEELAAQNPPVRERQPFKALLERDIATLESLGKQGILELFFATHAGMTEDDFEKIATAWLASARHPKFGRLFPQLAYTPQIELLDLLRENEFRTFIVSGGGIDLIRCFSEATYGIPRERVIGSSNKLRFETQNGRGVLMKLAELNSFDDRDVKPQNIGLHVGRRPIFAFGNSDGDLAMMRYTLTGPGPRLALLLHHDDDKREVAYDREFRLSPLAEALDKAGEYGITVVSMARDWKAVFTDA